MNKAILMGRLTNDVDLRQTPQGASVARFSIAVNRRYKDQNGNYPADFINCVAWRQTGEFVARYFRKGSMIAVVGSIQTRTWEGQDGKRNYATEVVVDEAHFTGSRAESGAQDNGGYGQGGYNQGYSAPQQNNNYNSPRSAPSSVPDFNDGFDDKDFAAIDGSEDDLPF